MRLFTVLVLFGVFWCASCNKYSKDANSMSNLFRTKKLNLIWEKVQKRLDNNELTRKRLHLDLIGIDKELLESKHTVADGKDPEGQTVVLVEKKLKEIMLRYNLGDILDAFQERKTRDMYDVDAANEKRVNSVTGTTENVHAFFKDKKLFNLWNEALKAGYSVEELLALKDELTHLQSKMEKYDGDTKRDVHANGNSIELELSLQDNKKDMKNIHNQIQQELKDLSSKIERDNSVNSEVGLKHPKAKQLWESALKGTFTGKELENLKEELKHFESRLEKLQFIKSQVDLSSQKMKNQGKEHLKHTEYADQERKLKDYSFKVEKLEKYLNSRIHSEL